MMMLIIIIIVIVIRIKVKKSIAKTENVKKAEVYNISTGQYQSSSGLLGKTTNIQNIYYCKIIKGSYMVWRGKVWLLRKINRKKDTADYTMIIDVSYVPAYIFRSNKRLNNNRNLYVE